MNRILTSAVSVVFALSLTNCASIVSKSTWPVAVTSSPSGLHYTIANKQGQIVHSGSTPSTVTLASSNGYFSGARYTVTVSSNGRAVGSTTISSHLNGWYLGNLVFGGLIGMLVVDPATGAMYALPESVHVQGSMASVPVSKDAPALRVATIDSLSAAQRSKLVRI